MKFITSVRSHGVVGMWKCSGKKCGRKTRSLFFGTIFATRKLDVSAFLKLVYEFSACFQVKEAVENVEVSPTTTVNFLKEFRKMMGDFFQEKKRLIGGPNTHVEVDETHMFKRKNNVGRVLRSQSWWVVGGICRETGEIFAVLVQSRKKTSLNEIIVQNIAPGTTILTDKWAAISTLRRLGRTTSTALSTTRRTSSTRKTGRYTPKTLSGSGGR